MTDTNVIRCPWCGQVMELEYYDECWFMECPVCLARSPAEATNVAALDAAAGFFKPLQVPLTLEEACGSEEPCVYIEYKGREIEAGIVYKQGTLNDVVLIIKCVESYREDYKSPEDYGKIVRCWATKPTDDERKAAKWEE